MMKHEKKCNGALGTCLAVALSTSWFSLGFVGCAASIEPASPDAVVAVDADLSMDAPATGAFRTGRNSDGTWTTIVDATSADVWIHGDFITGVSTESTARWSIRFQRFHMSVNGGVTGDAGVEVVPLDGVAFADVRVAPAAGWTTDTPDGPDDNTRVDYGFETAGGWYAYDVGTHVLTARNRVWLVRGRDLPLIKLEVQSYYDAAGTGGFVKLHWGAL